MKQRLWMCTSMLGLGLSALLVGCTGVVGEQPAGSAGSGGGGPGPAPTLAETECVEAASLAPARIWLLSDTQYVNIVRDAFGVSLSGKEREVTTAASKTGIFTNKSEAFKVDLSAAKGYQRTAALVAERLVPSLSTDAAGVQSFIDSRISRAWRRPVTPQESAALMQIYGAAAATDGGTRGASLVIQAALQAAPFVYRTEVGAGAANLSAPVPMTAHEVAATLGVLLFDSIPDDELWARAADGTILQPEVLKAQVQRLLALPVARESVNKLIGYWAGIEAIPWGAKDATLFPEYTAELRGNLYGSAQAFLSDLVWNGHFKDLFASRRVYVNQALAGVYGFPGVTGSAFTAVEFGMDRPAAGLLTQPGILATTNKRTDRADPIHRGLGIYYSFVCGATLPDPPAGAIEAAALMVGTERQIAEQRAANPICNACHSLVDPLGLATEQFDPIGRYRANDDAGQPIDASAVVRGLGEDLDGPISGIEELAARFQTSRRASDCAAATLASNAMGYASRQESCDLSRAKDVLAKSGSFAEFLTVLVQSRGFVMRDPNLD